MKTRVIVTMMTALAAMLAAGCKGKHGHDGEVAAKAPQTSQELPAQSVTVWTDQHELFMEYAPLVVGQKSRVAAHVTGLPNTAPMDGKVTLTVAGADALVSTVDGASSPGIFRLLLEPAHAGKCSLTLHIERGGKTDSIDAGACEIHPDLASAEKASAEAEVPGRITYLKEQQWKTAFATQFVAERELQSGIHVLGEIRSVPGKEARLSAPIVGRLTLTEPVASIGSAVKKGQLLATLTPTAAGAGADQATLSADVQAARAELAAAEAEVARAQRLLAERAIPERQLAEAQTRASIARSRVAGAGGRLGQFSAGAAGRGGRGAFQVRSPIDGELVVVNATTGQTVSEGEALFTVLDGDRIWLEAHIFEPDIPRVESASSAWFTVDGHDTPFEVAPPDGRVVTLGRMLDPESRTVPLIFELANPGGRLRIGQFAEVTVATGARVNVVALPEAALVDDAGTPVVYVELEGEAFERRPLILGIRSGGWVEVKSGVVAGERVVTKGAYEIKLASSAGSVPAHGHVH